jgi:hypothetical protein
MKLCKRIKQNSKAKKIMVFSLRNWKKGDKAVEKLKAVE